MTAALSLQNVSRRYGEQLAVDDLSFEVQPGRIFGFLGPNGAGKTTSIRMALGLAKPTSGRVVVLGSDDPRTVRDRIGFLPEERGLYKRMRALDAIAFFAQLKGARRDRAYARGRELLAELELSDAAQKPIKALSKGMAQKVQLASAVAHDPELVILDEPFSGLDPVNQQVLEALIRNLAARGATVIFSTHVMQHAERLCERLVLLSRGRKVFDGTVAEAQAAAPRSLLLEGALTGEAAAALPGAAGVEAAPGGWRVTLAPGASGADALRAAFRQELPVTGFEMREPSLHDAFIVLTGGGDAAAVPGMGQEMAR